MRKIPEKFYEINFKFFIFLRSWSQQHHPPGTGLEYSSLCLLLPPSSVTPHPHDPRQSIFRFLSSAGLVALAVRLIPPHNSYHDLKTGVTSEDIVGGKLSPNNINVSWITGGLILNNMTK